MKALIKSLILLLAFYNSSIWAIDCSQTNITLTTQVAVDDFQINFWPCDTVTGNLIIRDSDLTNLTGLNGLIAVNGTLTVLRLDSLNNLDGLSNITTVGGLSLIKVNVLTDISGLSNLSNITTDGLTIENTPNLSNLDALQGLTQVDGAFKLNNIPNMTSVPVLSGLNELDGRLIISNNSGLTSLAALSSIPAALKNVSIFNNNMLTDLAGLSQLSGDIERLSVNNNDGITSLNGLGIITSISNDLSINNNPILSDVSVLSSVTTIGGYFDFKDTLLANMDDFINLTHVIGKMTIQFNSQLTNLDGLSNLSGVIDGIKIKDNTILDNINGLSGILSSLGRVIIEDNPQLGSLDGLDNFIGNDGIFSIANNASLENINALSNLISVSGSLIIEDNPQLANCSSIVKLIDFIDDDLPGPGAGVVPDVGGNVVIIGNLDSCNSIVNSVSVIYVDVDTLADNSCTIGECWNHAFTNLQDALSIAIDGNTILVAAGIYYPDVGGSQVDDDKSATFTLIEGVSVFGGFNGTEILLNQRDPVTNLTILSGDIQQDDTHNNGIVENTDDIVGENSFNILIADTLSTTTVIDGFTITAGKGKDSGSGFKSRGAGMNCGDGTFGPSINQVTFIGNSAKRSGAIEGCTQQIGNSVFKNNSALGIAGVVYAQGGIIENTIFIGNRSKNNAGAIRNGANLLTITNSQFIANQSDIGKAGAIFSSADISLENVLFSGNKAGSGVEDDGGALFLQGIASVTLTNVTMTGNNANDQGGAIGSSSTGVLTINNSIIWNNLDGTVLGSTTSSINHPNGVTNINNSIVQGLGVTAENLDTDPLFVTDTDPTTAPTIDGDAHLTITSAAINAGDNSLVNSSTDLDGSIRILSNSVDMGAYEVDGYTVSVTITGLDAGAVVLQNNSAGDLSISNDGTYTFSTPVANNTGYLVTVLSQPTSPNQICSINNASGTINGADVVVEISCAIIQYNIGVDVTGLGNGLMVSFINNAETLDITSNGLFNFATALDDLSTYDVSITAQPNSANNQCNITSNNASGTISGADVIVTVLCSADIYYVDSTAVALGDGLSWDSAFNTLQDALEIASSGSEIWVAAGVYYPDEGESQLDDNRNATFTLIDGVSIYGGFDGTETDFNQRDHELNITVLSGDITQNDTVNVDNITETVGAVSDPNSFHVVVGSNVDTGTVLDGFTITAGKADGDNNRGNGGGIYCGNNTSGPNLNQMTIIASYASHDGGGAFGCSQLITNSIFMNNRTDREGGALRAKGGLIENTVFKNNSTAFDSGGAIRNFAAPLTINYSQFIANSSVNESGSAIYSSAEITINSTLFKGNKANGIGGVIVVRSDNATLSNVTMTGNRSNRSAGAINFLGDGSLIINNTIIWNNIDDNSTDPITHSINIVDNPTVLISNSLIQHSGGSGANWVFDPSADGGGNLDEDPLFILATDPTTAPTIDGNAHLTITSPAINTGDNSFVTSSTDLDGLARIQSSAVDMGAYESASASIAVTVTGLVSGTLVLGNNGVDDLTFSANATQIFSIPVEIGNDYLVTVLSPPTFPNQVCLIANGSGTINDDSAINVAVTCAIIKYNIGVDVTGLANGNSVAFDNNGESLTVNTDGQFNFATAMDDGSAYNVTVTTQPQMPNQMCSVVAGTGTISGADILLTVSCTTDQYFVGGMTSGLASGNAVILSLGAEELNVNSNTAFVFINPLTDESSYSVSVSNQPTTPNQTCDITNATGTIAGDDVDNLEVNCITNQYSVGGTVTGLHAGNNLLLQNNSGDDLSIASDGGFDFATAIDDLQSYVVSILNQPTNPIQPCVISNNTGNVAGNPVTTVVITCEFGDDLIFGDGFE